jgi:hypothetical protein
MLDVPLTTVDIEMDKIGKVLHNWSYSKSRMAMLQL